LIPSTEGRICDFDIHALINDASFEICPRFEDSEKLTRRDLRSLRDKFASTLIGFVLFEPENGFIFVILYNI